MSIMEDDEITISRYTPGTNGADGILTPGTITTFKYKCSIQPGFPNYDLLKNDRTLEGKNIKAQLNIYSEQEGLRGTVPGSNNLPDRFLYDDGAHGALTYEVFSPSKWCTDHYKTTAIYYEGITPLPEEE